MQVERERDGAAPLVTHEYFLWALYQTDVLQLDTEVNLMWLGKTTNQRKRDKAFTSRRRGGVDRAGRRCVPM